MRFTPSTLLLCIVLLLSCIVHVQAAPDAGNSVDPEAHVDYVINFDENLVKKEEMDMVADWLKQRNIEIKETELASYAAYQVATLNRKLADELMAFGKDKHLHIEEVEPDYLDWSDLDKEDL